MTPSTWLVLAAAGGGVYISLLLGLALAGRDGSARALARFLPDLLLLLRKLLRDPRLPVPYKLALAVGIAYLLLPIDLVPDFLPVVGQLDDVLVVALLLRLVLRGAGPAVVSELWPGPEQSLRIVVGLARP